MNSLPILYKYTQKGQVQQWQIHYEHDSFWTEEGIQGGAITINKPTVCKAKNVGRANATTPEQQAEAEAKAKWQKKVDSGYNEELTAEKKFFEPMLAHNYADHAKKITWGETRVFVQPKLDGLRAINNGRTIMSRNGKEYLSVPHLKHQYSVSFDGELYNHQFKEDFNKIVSLCKKQKPTDEELQESKLFVQHWIYDYPTHNGSFSERYEALVKWYQDEGHFNKGYIIVPTFEVFSEEEIKDKHAEFIGMGYEGTIVRVDGAPYKNGRSDKLLKFKDFIDEEFEIAEVIEGEGGRTGTVGKFIMKHEDGNRMFGSNVKGTHAYLADLLKNKESLIGRTATVKYFNRTPDGIPRFPFVIKINREEYE